MKKVRLILNLIMLVVFLSSAVTGIIKFPEFQKFFSSVYSYVNVSTISFVHDWSGIALVLLIITHLVLNLRIIALSNNERYQRLVKIAKIVSLIFLVVVAATLLFSFFQKNKPVRLNSAEIQNYQGQKLGSIDDFRENSIKGPQYIDKRSYKLEVSGLVNNEKSLSYDDVLSFAKYQKVVTINCVEGWSVKILWEGPLVRDIINSSGLKPEAKTVIFYAADGYSTSFPVDYIMKNDIIMADKMNDVELPPERGFPFQLVAEDKWGYKWIKWITKIELSDDVNYEGYWEQRGYNNDGSLSGPKFE